MSWVMRVAAELQRRPQEKKVRRGRAQGSTEKFQEAKQDQGVMEEGLTADLKALRAEMSEGEVRD